MPIFQPRRTRSAKAASLKANSSLVTRVSCQLSNTDVLLRICVCTLFLGLLALSIGSWRMPFPFHQGDLVKNGILAKIDFERVNEDKTNLALLAVEDRVPPVFVLDAEPLWNLRYILRSQLFEVAEVQSLKELGAETRAKFGLSTPVGAETPASISPEQERDWKLLKDAIGPDKTDEQRIDEVVLEFDQFTSSLREFGVLDPAETTRRDLQPDQHITIVDRDGPTQELRQILIGDALLAETLKPSGRLGRMWKSYPAIVKLQPVLERWLLNSTPVTLQYDELLTRQAVDDARLTTEPISDSYKRGSVLVAPGSRLTEENLNVLRAQYDAIERSIPFGERIVRIVTVVALLLVLGSMIGYHLVRNEPRLVTSIGRLTVLLSVVTATIALAQWLSVDPWRAEVIPILCTAMVLSIAYNQVLGALAGFTMCLVVTLSTGGSVDQFVILMASVSAAVVPLQQVASRSKLVLVGFGTAVTFFVVTWGVSAIGTQQFSTLWADQQLLYSALRGAGWCLAAGYLVAGSLPFVEQTFGVVTDISLLELSDISHPLLQELVRRAPGTYNHSIGVATISETAADAIGANGLLCRVGAYFHDIGKMLKPQYFVENMLPGQGSRHEHLAPAMSTLIIIGHVKDGVDLAQQHGLPGPLIDFIEQHHGTTLVEYFYHAATKAAGADPDLRAAVEEAAFRYPGPKPQSKEAAVMMIADAVEGASRTLSDPTPRRIETLVHEIAIKRLLDGQFDESSLTLSELAIVEDSLTKSLIGIYHGRIKYPEQKTA